MTKRQWLMEIAGELASKANSRRLIPGKRGQRPRVIKSAKAIRYVRDVHAQVAVLPELLEGPLEVTAVCYYASERPDLDISLLLDALQGRVYKNDRQVREHHLYHKIDRERPRVHVLVEEMT